MAKQKSSGQPSQPPQAALPAPISGFVGGIADFLAVIAEHMGIGSGVKTVTYTEQVPFNIQSPGGARISGSVTSSLHVEVDTKYLETVVKAKTGLERFRAIFNRGGQGTP